jgi:hypothetical protein
MTSLKKFGTYSLRTLLARDPTILAFGEASQGDPLELDKPIIEYGESRLLAAFTAALAVHNAAVNDLVTPLVTFTNKRIEPYGENIGVSRVRGVRTDQYGAVDTMREQMPPMEVGNIGYPLERVQFAWQVTRDYEETNSPRDIAKRMAAIQLGDLDDIEYQIRNAFFNPVSNLTYRDQLIDQLLIPVRRLANGDGQMLPLGPRGEVFNPGTHTHYMGVATGTAPTAADIQATFTNVIEHGPQGKIELWINEEDEPAIRDMANFWGYDAQEVIVANYPPGTERMRQQGPLVEMVDPLNPDNMKIGKWNAKYEVSTKPWVYPGYFIVIDLGRKALRWRSRQNPSNAFGATGRSNLRIVAEAENFPLRATWMEREYGIGVGDRLAAAVLYGGGTSYVMPTITMPALY